MEADIDARVFTAFLRVIADVVVFNQQVAERLHLGASDMQFMTHLQLRGPLTPGELARLSGLRSGTVTGVIDRLETAGFIHRERDAADRRRVHVVLDDAKVRREVMPAYAAQGERLSAVLAGFDAREREVVARFLEGLLAEDAARGDA